MNDDPREFCRDFIDRHCIYRSPPGKLDLVGLYGLDAWRFFLPVALLDPEFQRAVGSLFWERYEQYQFQLCGLETSGASLMVILQAAAHSRGMHYNGFEVKKAPKDYGLQNHLEGIVSRETPVLLIDDTIGSGRSLQHAAVFLRSAGLELFPEAFAIAAAHNDAPETLKIEDGFDGIVMPPVDLKVNTLFQAKDFVRMWGEYVTKYGEEPEFHGSLV